MIALKTEQLETELARREWRLEDLAAASGLSISMLYSIRSGARSCGAATIEGLQTALGLSFDDLFEVIPEGRLREEAAT